jgi:hypothetical protein
MTDLAEYGILQENSHIRAHVSVTARCVYAFRTRCAIDAVSTGKYPKRQAYQPGINGATAAGFIVPVNDIEDVRRVVWNDVQWWTYFQPDMTTTQKGALAVRVVQRTLERGLFPLWLSGVSEVGKELDIQGTDILINGVWRLQVKCDYNAGDGGTGNLYIQTAERNPLKRY